MKPSIPNPCSEDWDKMKIGQISRHCTSCEKDVMDFTQKSRHEILTYLIENRNQRVCGHLYPSQLDYRYEEILLTIRTLEKKHRNTNLSYYLLTMATLSLMACESEQPRSAQKVQTSVLSGQHYLPEMKDTMTSVKDEAMTMCSGEGYFESPVSGDMIPIPEVPPTVGILIPQVIPPEDVINPQDRSFQKPRMLVEVMPEFEGGTEALMKYIEKHLKYPRWEKENGVEGTVYATFVIDEKGKVSSPEILKSVEGSRNFDEKVLKLLKNMPQWKPGMEKGVKVPVQFNLPFRFKL